MRIMRKHLSGGQHAYQMPKGGKSAPKGGCQAVKTEIDTSFSCQGDKKKAALVTMRAAAVSFSTAC